ncbi:hypothetical protein ACLOJK_006949, partial [Asimina triloba]
LPVGQRSEQPYPATIKRGVTHSSNGEQIWRPVPWNQAAVNRWPTHLDRTASARTSSMTAAPHQGSNSDESDGQRPAPIDEPEEPTPSSSFADDTSSEPTISRVMLHVRSSPKCIHARIRIDRQQLQPLQGSNRPQTASSKGSDPASSGPPITRSRAVRSAASKAGRSPRLLHPAISSRWQHGSVAWSIIFSSIQRSSRSRQQPTLSTTNIQSRNPDFTAMVAAESHSRR